jgi:pre-mRNA-processing factor SLU7
VEADRLAARSARKARKKAEVLAAEVDKASGGTAAADGHGEDSDFSTDSSDDGSDKDEDKDVGDYDVRLQDGDAKGFQSRTARQGGVGGAQMKTTISNLRIREDVPKYLRNLDLESAYYDPKTRAMRANPNPHADPDELAFAGDNFVRHTGDAVRGQTHTHTDPYTHTHIHTYIHTYIHTHTHTYIHTYIHTLSLFLFVL